MKELKEWFSYLCKNPGNETQTAKAKISLIYNYLQRSENRIKELEEQVVKNKQLIDSLKKAIDCQVDFNDEIINSVLELSPGVDVKQSQTPAPPPKYKYVVKSKPELIQWFKENDYKISKDINYYHDCSGKRRLSFNTDIFFDCGNEINNFIEEEDSIIYLSYKLLPEWLNKIPVDEPEIKPLSQEEWDGIKERLKQNCRMLISKNDNHCPSDSCVCSGFCAKIFRSSPDYWDTY